MAQTTWFRKDIQGKWNDGEQLIIEILDQLWFKYDYLANKHYHYDFEIDLNWTQDNILKKYFLNKSNWKEIITLDSKNNLFKFNNWRYYIPLEIVNNWFLIANYDYLNIFNNDFNWNDIRKENREFVYLTLDDFLNLDIQNIDIKLNNKIKEKQILLNLTDFKNKKDLKDTLIYLMHFKYQNTYYLDNFNLEPFNDKKLDRIENFYNENKELVDKILNISQQNFLIPVYLMFSTGWSTETWMTGTDFIASISTKHKKIYLLNKEEVIRLVREKLFDKQKDFFIIKATLNKISNKVDQRTWIENIWQSNYWFVNVPANSLMELDLSDWKYEIFYYN